jgi:hypothetical protein
MPSGDTSPRATERIPNCANQFVDRDPSVVVEIKGGTVFYR